MNLVRSFLIPPVFPDDERTRLARLLHWTIIAGAAIIIFDVLILLIFAPETIPTFWINAVMLLVLALATWLMRRGDLHAGSILICASLWLLLTIYLVQSGGVYSPALGVLNLVVIVAAILLGMRGSMVFGGLCILTALGVYWGGNNGWLTSTEAPPTAARLFATHTAIFAGLAILMGISARSVDYALKRARISEKYLLERNQQLEQAIAEHNRTEAALKGSEERFSKAFQANPSALMISTFDEGRFVDVNASALKLLGRTRDEIVDHTGLELEMWINLEERATAMKELQEKGTIRDGESQFHTKSGAYRDALVSFELIELGGQPHVLSLIEDYTDRKQAEERFYKAFHANPTSLTISTLEDGRFIDVNEGCLKMLDYTREEMVGHTAAELSTWADLEDRATALQMLKETGSVRDMQTRFRRKSGELRDALVSLEVVELGDKPHLLGMVQDITERKQAEIQLHESEEALRHLSDAAFEGIGMSDQGRILHINKRMSEMLGYSEDELIGKSVLSLVAPESHAQVLQHMQSSYEKPYDHMAIRKDGSEFPVEVIGRTINYQGRPVRVTAIRDLTLRKQAEQQQLELALQTERLEAFKEFLSKVSHDLKTPLSVINTSLYLLERTEDPERQRGKIEAIREQAGLVETFIQDLLTLSRLERVPELALAPLNLNQLFSDVQTRLNTAAEHKNLTLRFRLDSAIPDVIADSSELYRALFNLVENAVNYTLAEGSVTVETAPGENGVVAHISDTGIGIPAEALPYIFDRFYRADQARQLRNTGTGLGLAIVRRIIEIHNGTIAVESTPGVGTTFRLWLPLAP